MKRYFEFTSGSAAKFWEIGVDGGDVAVRFGRIEAAELPVDCGPSARSDERAG